MLIFFQFDNFLNFTIEGMSWNASTYSQLGNFHLIWYPGFAQPSGPGERCGAPLKPKTRALFAKYRHFLRKCSLCEHSRIQGISEFSKC
jgi:hypothetical protein